MGAPATWYHHHSDLQGYQRGEEAAKFHHGVLLTCSHGARPRPADDVEALSAIMRYDFCS
jgi:hypothetical protein